MRVLEWVVERCRGRANASEGLLGWVPDAHDFDLEGLDGFDAARLQQAQSTNAEEWRREVLQQDELFMRLYAHLPKEIIFQRELLIARL